MQIESLALSDVKIITPEKYEDNRGFFVESFRQDKIDRCLGQQTEFVQENYSVSKARYTVRGLHAQLAPHAQGKLVRCVCGKIRDVAVDARLGSPSFGQSVMVDLCASDLSMLWVPEGFLHGFITLEDNTEVSYKCTNYYAPEHAVHVDWQDKNLNIDWGVDPSLAVLSKKDRGAQSFKNFEIEFMNSN